MVVTVLEAPKKAAVLNKQMARIEAAELLVPKNDSVIPTKLKLLGAAGWAIVDVYKDNASGDFTLLLTRNVGKNDA